MRVLAGVITLLALHTSIGNAVGWSFAEIAANSTGFSSLPAINAKGEVAFSDSTGNFLFVGDGRSLRTVYQTGDYSFLGVGGHPDINASATLAFLANHDGSNGVFRGSGGEPTLISSLGGNTVTINNRGIVAFSSGSVGVFSGAGAEPVTIASADGPLWGFDEASINDKGTVAFHALYDTGGAGIFVGDGRTLQTVADSSGPLMFDGNFGRHAAINNAGEVAFMANLDAGGQGVFIWHRNVLTTVATVQGTSLDDQSISLNNGGAVAFKSGGILYIASRGELQRVIGGGDSLSGANISFIGFGWRGLNDAGELAFFATLSDGRIGIYRASQP